MTDQLFTGSYPSDALTEAKQLRARVAELESGIKCALGCLDDPTGGTCVQDARKAQSVLRDALEVAPEPFCAALQKQEGGE
jgi:Cdc6-like AAA superfamily ATPase